MPPLELDELDQDVEFVDADAEAAADYEENDGVENPDAQNEPEEQPEPKVQQPEQRQDPKYNDLAARHRILSRQKEASDRRVNELAGQMQQLIQILTQGARPQPTDQLPDAEEDPTQHIIKRFDRIEQAILTDQQQREQARIRQEAEDREIENYADARSAAVEFRSSLEDPVEYDQALMYLGRLAFEEALEDDQTSTEEEIRDRLSEGLVKQMRAWHNAGYNPGEKLMSMAKRRGFTYERPPEQPQPRVRPRQPQQRGSTAPARQQIRSEKERQGKARSISGLSGAAAGSRNSTPARHLQVPEEEWVRENKSTSMRDLLKGKGRHDVVSTQF